MSCKTCFELYVAHLSRLVADPGLNAHGWYRVRELEACDTGQWRGLHDAVNAELAARGLAALARRAKAQQPAGRP